MIEAYWRFRSVLKEKGGPIDGFSISSVSIDNQLFFQTNSKLCSSIRVKYSSTFGSDIYNDVDGTGTDTNKHTSVFKSFSETLERWAYYESYISQHPSIALDHTSTGFAFLPTYFTNSARTIAQAESTERYCLHLFSLGALKLKKEVDEQIDVYTCIIGNFVFSLLHFHDIEHGNHIYGFACHIDKKISILKARIELERNKITLKNLTRKDHYSNIHDHNLIFYSTDEGYALFQNRIIECLKVHNTSEGKIIYDNEIKGPWSKYGKVWRHLYEMPHAENLFIF